MKWELSYALLLFSFNTNESRSVKTKSSSLDSFGDIISAPCTDMGKSTSGGRQQVMQDLTAADAAIYVLLCRKELMKKYLIMSIIS